MIATLSSFETQFKPVLIEKGKALFEQGKLGPLKDLNPVWQAEVTDTKVYKEVTVRAVDGKVTDIFCPCGPAICRHVIALMFTLRQELRITPELFDPAMLIPPPPPAHVTLGRKLNDLIYASRAAGTKDGELEELGASFNMKDPDVPKLRAMVHKGWFFPNERSKYPILNGAKRMLGAAILKYEQKDYRFVFDVARAILTEICSTEIVYYGTSPTECCRAAIELLNELCTAPEVPADLKKEVFSRVLFASGKKLYELYHEELLAVLRNPLLDRELQELAAADLGNAASEAERSSPLTLHAQSHLLEQLGRTEEQEQLMLNNPHHFRRELIEKAYADKDYDTVKRLAREGLGGSARDAAQWTEWLFKIAQEEGDVNSGK